MASEREEMWTMCACGHHKFSHNEFVGGGHPCYYSEDGETFCACERFTPTPSEAPDA